MPNDFFSKPILNSPYDYPRRHWKLDESGQPTDSVVDSRRETALTTIVPKAKKSGKAQQQDLGFNRVTSASGDEYEMTAETVNALRRRVDAWRVLQDSRQWKVTAETERLLKHWRSHEFTNLRPFFCQIEAVEAAIWLTEVAPQVPDGKRFLEYLDAANEEANPGLSRIALKLATGAGKTMVMALLIAWQTVNAVRKPSSTRFTRGFLVVAPGITIRDRLQVLQPNDPNSYYKDRELVPRDMLPDLNRAHIVITNYHAFRLRETMSMPPVSRALAQGRGEPISTTETEGQMVQRVMPELMGIKNVMVLNDEAHHCYRLKPGTGGDEDAYKSDEKDEAKSNNKAASLWISGLEAVQRQLGIRRIIDLSATPFFLSGSGYREGTLFPWTMTNFSLMDAIECGIVKLPRVPVADNNVTGEDGKPMFRNLWHYIGKAMPKKGRSKGQAQNPEDLRAPQLWTALEALYGHYVDTFEQWKANKLPVEPCFIVVCSNTAASKLVYDYIAGYEVELEDGTSRVIDGRCELFRNYDENHTPLARPRTLLIDSQQLESGDALDPNFRKVAGDEIERFKREIKERGDSRLDPDKLSEADLLREAMNTVGKPGQLGGSIRCVVSVAMLTEGWDANTVTHILGIRAFGTQLLCEQVIGRALRRQSYELNDDGLFNVEYADVFGIPFDFMSKAVKADIKPPPPVTRIEAVSPERDHLAVTFPRVIGYRVELPTQRLVAEFDEDSTLEVTPDLIGPSITENAGLMGESVNMTLGHTQDARQTTIIMRLALHVMKRHFDSDANHYGDLKRIVRRWLEKHLVCRGQIFPAQVLTPSVIDMAAERIKQAIDRAMLKVSKEIDPDANPIRVIPDPYNPTGTTAGVKFNTTKQDLWDTKGPPPKCHLNYVVCDSDWEAEFCRIAEQHRKVLAYFKNHSVGFEVPYTLAAERRMYRPDFILKIDDGHGPDDPLHLVVEVKGYRGEDAKQKKLTMDAYWIPGVNAAGTFGRWAHTELCDVYDMTPDFDKKLESVFNDMLDRSTSFSPRDTHGTTI